MRRLSGSGESDSHSFPLISSSLGSLRIRIISHSHATAPNSGSAYTTKSDSAPNVGSAYDELMHKAEELRSADRDDRKRDADQHLDDGNHRSPIDAYKFRRDRRIPAGRLV